MTIVDIIVLGHPTHAQFKILSGMLWTKVSVVCDVFYDKTYEFLWAFYTFVPQALVIDGFVSDL